MKKILLNEAEKKAIILEREKAIVANFAKTFNSIKRIDENEVQGNNDKKSAETPSEISNELVKALPELINDKTIKQISDAILNDPKAIEELKKFMNMGGVNEVETNNTPLPDINFMKKAINYGIQHSKNLTEGDDQGGNIGAFMGLFAGGAYLADKFFPNPMVMGKIATNIGFVNQLIHQYDPMAVGSLGGLAAAILGCIAYNVFKKLK